MNYTGEAGVCKYRLRRYESGTMCRMALAYTPELQIPIYLSFRHMA